MEATNRRLSAKPKFGHQTISLTSQKSGQLTPKKGTTGSTKLSLPSRFPRVEDQNDTPIRLPSPTSSLRLEHAIEYERLNGMPLITYDPLETFETEDLNSSMGSVGADDFPKNQILDWSTKIKPLSSLKGEISTRNSTTLLQYNLLSDNKETSSSKQAPKQQYNPTKNLSNKLQSAVVAKVSNNGSVEGKPAEKNSKLMLKKFITNAKNLKSSPLLEVPTSKTDRIDLCNLYKRLSHHERDNHTLELFGDDKFHSNPRASNTPQANTNQSFNSTQTYITVMHSVPSTRQSGPQLLRPVSPENRPSQLRERPNSNSKTTYTKSTIKKKQSAMFNEQSQSSHYDLSNVSTDIRGKSQEYIFSENVSSLNYPHVTKVLLNHKSDNPDQKRQKEVIAGETKKDKDRKATPAEGTLQFSNKRVLSISIPEPDQTATSGHHTKKSSKTERQLPSSVMMKTMPSGMRINTGEISQVENEKNKHSSPTSERKNTRAQENPDYLNVMVMKSLGFKPLKQKDIISVIQPSKHSDFRYNPKYFKPISDDRISQLVSSLTTSR